jgi:hypothetical protein
LSDPAEPASPPAHPLLAYEAVADVLLDKVQLGFDLLLPTVAVGDAYAFCADLARRGVLARRPARGAALRGALTVAKYPVPLAQDGLGHIEGQLALSASAAGHLVITRRSRLVINPLRDLRSQLIEPGAKATDGNDNLVWEYGPEWPHLLGWQLANVAVMVDAFLDAVAAAAGMAREQMRGRVWVQQCEVCRDYAISDAEAVVRELAARPIPGAGLAKLRTVAERRRNLLCVAWHEGAGSSPERKVYAKRDDLLRAEISVRARPAVKALLARRETISGTSADIGGAAVGLLLADMALAAAPLLDRVCELIDERAAVPPRGGLDLLIGLAPLTHLISPAPRQGAAGGRRPNPSLPGRARRALDHLLASGTYDARGLGASDAVLLALRAMVAAGTLAAPPKGRRLFTVSPALEAARRALSEARLSEDDSGVPED